jgi:uncharacterized membrane protein
MKGLVSIIDIRPHIQLSSGDLPDSKPGNLAKSGIKRAVTITQTTVIKASIEHCFEFIDKQLEETPHWDPLIKRVNRISTKHARVGSMSRVTFDFNGVIEEAVVMIRSFRSNRVILWTSNHSRQLQEEWQLQPEPHGTVVTVSLGYNPPGWVLGRLTDKIFTRRKIGAAVSDMLKKLKAAAEG